jgi:redox-sensing transcriptional repressor
VQSLYGEMAAILGATDGFDVILVGAGNMGQALANYNNFEKRGFRLLGIFEIDQKIVGTKINGIEVMDFNNIEDFVQQYIVDIAILCVPFDKTPDVADRLARIGVKGLWNFSPMDLELKHDVTIENVHLSDSLMVLGYRMSEKQKNETQKIK